jgi:hypothetical protein
MVNKPPYFVVLDSNPWIAERLLQSAMGTALLYALTKDHGLIGLPEVVELEVNPHLEAEASKATEDIRKKVNFLRQLSSRSKSLITLPSDEAVREGIANRWHELKGVIHRVPYTNEQSRAALLRVISKNPPSGPNNEQFRDCCVWEAAMQLARSGPVYLVTSDNAFYEARDRARGLSLVLADEVKAASAELCLFPSLRELLAKLTGQAITLDEGPITQTIVAALGPIAAELAVRKSGGSGDLGAATGIRIKGYATPKPSIIAISFDVSYPFAIVSKDGDAEQKEVASMDVRGVCSYDPNTKGVSDIEIREWSKRLGRGHRSSMSTFSMDLERLQREFDPRRMVMV